MMKQLSVVSCQSSVDSRRAVADRLQTTDYRHACRTGVTLVELLITILILSMLAAMILGVAAVAGETAREAKTRNMVARLHTLLVEHADSYKDRRVKVRQNVVDSINTSTSPTLDQPAERGYALAKARLYGLREMMIMEMPDRWSDVLLNTVPNSPTGTPLGAADARVPHYLEGRTELANVFLRRYMQMVAGGATRAQILENQGAECLYLVITLACGDGEARSLFHESDIGDTDEDGAPEFLDGWGNPISFMRWAPGYLSQIQLSVHNFGGQITTFPPTQATSPDWLAAADLDHDPNDIYRVERWAFRMVPYICSSGSDEAYGYYNPDGLVLWRGALQDNPLPYATFSQWVLSPYQEIEIAGYSDFLGSVLRDDDDKPLPEATDNIDNHLLSTR